MSWDKTKAEYIEKEIISLLQTIYILQQLNLIYIYI